MAAESIDPMKVMDMAAAAAETRLKQNVEITDAGPCRKKVKISIERDVIDGRFNEKYDEITKDRSMALPGFRPGKAPRNLLVKKFKGYVKEEVRREVLMASLQQLAEDSSISPLAPPDLQADQLEIPESGPFVYEFEVEVRPEFNLPDMSGIKIRKPVQEFTEEDIAQQQKALLERFGKTVDKPGPVAIEDVVICDLVTKDGDKELNKASNLKLRVDEKLILADGTCEDFGAKMNGAKIGDQRSVEIKLGDSIEDETLRGKTIQGQFTVKEIKKIEIPALNEDILMAYGVRNEEQLQELIEANLRRNLEYHQRQAARSQILKYVLDNVKFDLPPDMIKRQATRSLQRKIVELRSSGFPEEQIVSQIQMLQQDAINSTAVSLMEHFILQKVAEDNKIEIEDSEIDDEIRRIAEAQGESFRKVKAQFEREDSLEAVASEILEAKALDIILKNAVYEEYDLKAEKVDEKGTSATSAKVVSAPAAE